MPIFVYGWLCTPVYGCCVRGTQRGTQANCGNYGDVLKWLRPLKTKGLRWIRAYSTVCNSYHGGRAHRSHRWGRWFESNCHHHPEKLEKSGFSFFLPSPGGTHFIATAVNSPGRVLSSHAGCSSKRFRVNPLLMMAFIISLIVYLLYRHLGNCSRISLS